MTRSLRGTRGAAHSERRCRGRSYSVDGILACVGIAPAIRAQVKLSVGVNQLQEVRTEDLIQQAAKVNRGFAHYQAMFMMFIRWRSPVPPFIHRLEAMLEWAGLPPARDS